VRNIKPEQTGCSPRALKRGVRSERGRSPLSNSFPSPAKKNNDFNYAIGWRGVRGEVFLSTKYK
jgi:hypothetical protein